MQLTLFTDYGLRTLMYLLPRKGATASVKEISEYHGISRHHLTKVVHRLAMLGHVVTIKGKGGGIRIAEGAEALRLGDLISELEPNMTLVECFDAKINTCRMTTGCQLKHFLRDAMGEFITSMNRYTLADTIGNMDIALQPGNDED